MQYSSSYLEKQRKRLAEQEPSSIFRQYFAVTKLGLIIGEMVEKKIRHNCDV